MDRALALKYGAPYIHMAAFAIDIDRVLQHAGERDPRPFAWEVFLTAAYLEHAASEHPDERSEEMLEEAALSILDRQPGDVPLGAQLAFAIYDLLRRGKLPEQFESVFRQWRVPLKRGSKKRRIQTPDKDVDALFKDHVANAAKLAASCLKEAIDPPLAPPTRKSLEALARPI